MKLVLMNSVLIAAMIVIMPNNNNVNSADSKVPPLPHQGIMSKFRQVRIHQRSYADALMEEQQQRERCSVNRLTALYKMAFVWTGNNRDIFNPTAGVSSSPQKASSCFKYWPHENVALKGQKASH